jgi:hypothetical protein
MKSCMRWSHNISKNSLTKIKKTPAITRTTFWISGTTLLRPTNVCAPRQQKIFSSANRNKSVTDASDPATSTAYGAGTKKMNFTNARCATSRTAFQTGESTKFYLPGFCAKSRKIKFNIKLICLSNLTLRMISLFKPAVLDYARTTSMRSPGPWIALSTWIPRS